jgi:ADP-heptose:LPS heptosyltransferase
VEKISELMAREGLDIKLVQLGAPGSKILEGTVNLAGQTTFREAKRVMEKSLFLVTTEGGMAHLAASIPKKSFVLISAMLPYELMAYPHNVNFYTEVECKNCGLTSPCPYNLKCMKLITTETVYGEIEKELKKIFNIT